MHRFIVSIALLTVASGCSLLPGMSPKKSNAPSNSPGANNAPPPGAEEEQPGSSESPKPSGPAVVSVSLKNECKETVKLFFGDKPKFGSGTYSTLGSNTRTSKQMTEGDMIWLVDDSQNGIASVTIASGMRNIEVVKGCDGIVSR